MRQEGPYLVHEKPCSRRTETLNGLLPENVQALRTVVLEVKKW